MAGTRYKIGAFVIFLLPAGKKTGKTDPLNNSSDRLFSTGAGRKCAFNQCLRAVQKS